MRCEESKDLLEALIDGELESRTAETMLAHLAACEPCSRLEKDLAGEQAIYSAYRRDVEVTPAMWRAVEKRIGLEDGDQTRRPAFGSAGWLSRILGAPALSFSVAAALVVVAVLVTIAAVRYLESRNARSVPQGTNQDTASQTPTNAGDQHPGDQTEHPVPTPRPHVLKAGYSAATRKPTPDQLVREAEQKYITAIAMMTRDVERRRGQLDPVMLAQLDQALMQMDRIIAQTKRAMREDSNDPNAVQYLLAAYSRKYEALKEVASY